MCAIERSNSKSFESLSHDALREKTVTFKQRIAEVRKPYEQAIEELQGQVVQIADIDQKERLYEQIDLQEQEATHRIEALLNELLPEAFAVVKETARRFVHNTTLEVTATPYDRTLSETYAHVSLNGDQAVWSNSWDAAGKPITWDMIHYDVQLIGGIVLH